MILTSIVKKNPCYHRFILMITGVCLLDKKLHEDRRNLIVYISLLGIGRTALHSISHSCFRALYLISWI